MLSLGFSSLFELSLPKVFSIAGKSILKFLSGISIAGTVLFAVLVAIAYGIWLSWKENFNNIREWFKVLIKGFKEGIGNPLGIIKIVVNFAPRNVNIHHLSRLGTLLVVSFDGQ